jgi:uncharacterized protein (DUF1778 family)
MDENPEFVATPNQWCVFTKLLDRPAHAKPELARLFSELQKQDFLIESNEGTE